MEFGRQSKLSACRYRFSVTDSDRVAESRLPSAVEAALRIDEADRTAEQNQQLFSAWRVTVAELSDVNAKIEELWQSFPETDSQLVVHGRSTPRPTYVLRRGDFLDPGEQVTPAAPAFLNTFPESGEPARLRFARWLVARDSPTTARVIVNRIWQAYFGRGIVNTPEDFGFQSAPPTHPQLIDWLAVELMENNWSLRRMALPVWWQGFRSGSGLEFLLILLSGFCHQGKHLGTSFVSSGFDSAFAMSDSLAAARLLSRSLNSSVTPITAHSSQFVASSC